jgi:hypothetical protein
MHTVDTCSTAPCHSISSHFAAPQIVVGMFIGDLTDEDLVQRRRSAPMSSFFYAIRSFFTVWADSLVPVAVVRALEVTGYVGGRENGAGMMLLAGATELCGARLAGCPRGRCKQWFRTWFWLPVVCSDVKNTTIYMAG